MHQMDFLVDVILIFGVSLVVNLLLSRLRQPTILGYILSGLLIGPHGLGWIAHGDLETLAEVGIVLLMFTLGIEFSFDKMKRLKGIALGGGSMQIGLTILAGIGVALALDWTWYRGIYLGCLVALSSSAIVLKLLQEGGELDTLHGRIALGILLFQDLAVVPMMIVLPALASPGQGIWLPLAVAAGKAALFLTGALVMSRVLLPRLFFQVARTRNRELFLMLALSLCMGTAWVSYLTGLSLALGAFVAGMVVSDSDYSLQTLSDILPFKDAFLCVFFVSVGMLLDPSFVFSHPEILGIVVLLVLLLNFVICSGVALVFRYPLRVALFAGAVLSQIGEFSFVLAQMGKGLGLIGDYLYQLTLTGTVLTMMLTPQLFKLGRRMPDWLLRLGVPQRWLLGRPDEGLQTVRLTGHVIVCGYGPVGQRVSQVLQENGIPFLILELNALRVRRLKADGLPVFYGDSSSSEVLHQAGVEQAKAVVVSYADPHAARKTVAAVRTLHPETPVAARTRLPEDIAELRRLGAERVVEEEFEVSLEMAAWTLKAVGVSWIAVETEKTAIQEDGYRLFSEPHAHLCELSRLADAFSHIEIATYQVVPRGAFSGKTLGEIRLRSEMGVTLLSAVGAQGAIFNPGADYRFMEGDTVTLVGDREHVRTAGERIGLRLNPAGGAMGKEG